MFQAALLYNLSVDSTVLSVIEVLIQLKYNVKQMYVYSRVTVKRQRRYRSYEYGML